MRNGPDQDFTIASACRKDGSSPAGDFFEGLSLLNQAKLVRLFEIAGNARLFKNDEKFGDLGNGLFEFKSHQIRMPYAYAKGERGVIVVSHGFIKKKQKAPPEEIRRAREILEEDYSACGAGRPKPRLLERVNLEERSKTMGKSEK